MSTNQENENELFKPDRRAAVRPDDSERRMAPRPSWLLTYRGFLAAAAVAALISAILYHFWK